MEHLRPFLLERFLKFASDHVTLQ
uniref:Uncharacterized protein n=1 Tax=Anguilla anguilla TaxID=7936 RepID=A0A0E9VFA1_ANGAN